MNSSLGHPTPPARHRLSRRGFVGTAGSPGLPYGFGKTFKSRFVDPENPPPPLFVPGFLNDKLWHIPFNRVDDELIVDMVKSNADAYIPVLGIGGANSWGPAAAGGIKPAATDVQTLVIPGVGHWVAEQAPAAMIQALRSFLAPYRTAAG